MRSDWVGGDLSSKKQPSDFVARVCDLFGGVTMSLVILFLSRDFELYTLWM